jgi:hypothetical protein
VSDTPDVTPPGPFDRITIRLAWNGYVVRGEHSLEPPHETRDTPCWTARDRNELVVLVRRLMADPPEGGAR